MINRRPGNRFNPIKTPTGMPTSALMSRAIPETFSDKVTISIKSGIMMSVLEDYLPGQLTKYTCMLVPVQV